MFACCCGGSHLYLYLYFFIYYYFSLSGPTVDELKVKNLQFGATIEESSGMLFTVNFTWSRPSFPFSVVHHYKLEYESSRYPDPQVTCPRSESAQISCISAETVKQTN